MHGREGCQPSAPDAAAGPPAATREAPRERLDSATARQ